MAKYSTGSTLGLNRQQFLACDMLARGCSEEEVKAVIWNISKDSTLSEKSKATRRLREWTEDPKFIEGYRAIVRQLAYPAYGSSLKRLMKQVNYDDDKMAWVANKAANDIMNRYSGIIMGDEDKQIVVKVEGMPELGTPDAED